MKNNKCCIQCGKDISYKPSHHYLCYDCWRKFKGRASYSRSSSYSYYDEVDDNPHNSYNETYYERYIGDSEYDLGPDWDYDEYPPENL